MNGANFDQILADLRQHITNLQDKNSIADKLISRTQNVTQSLSTMKEVRRFTKICGLRPQKTLPWLLKIYFYF